MAKRPTRMSNKLLREELQSLNAQFFSGRIPPDIQIEFGNTDGEDASATYDYNRRKITVSRHLKKNIGLKIIRSLLLHEMIHVDLGDEYAGYPCDEGHGTRFHGEICRLWRAGAFDGQL